MKKKARQDLVSQKEESSPINKINEYDEFTEQEKI